MTIPIAIVGSVSIMSFATMITSIIVTAIKNGHKYTKKG